MQINRVIKSLVAAVGVAATFSVAHAADITGAGATFPYPIYANGLKLTKKLLATV
jgi:phosphate transport system substrate-binding protein